MVQNDEFEYNSIPTVSIDKEKYLLGQVDILGNSINGNTEIYRIYSSKEGSCKIWDNTGKKLLKRAIDLSKNIKQEISLIPTDSPNIDKYDIITTLKNTVGGLEFDNYDKITVTRANGNFFIIMVGNKPFLR